MPFEKTTTRPYDLEIREHRAELYATHCAMNAGAAAALEWLLTVRGGMPATAVLSVNAAKSSGTPATAALKAKPAATRKKKDAAPAAIARLPIEDAMRMLLYCWFSAETGSPHLPLAPTEQRLRAILAADGMDPALVERWCEIAAPVFAAPLREDAVWIDRRAQYDTRKKYLALSPEAIDDVLVRSGLMPPLLEMETARNASCIQAARGWLSRRLGSGTGADFPFFAALYDALSHYDGPYAADAVLAYLGYPDAAALQGDVRAKANGHRSRTLNRLQKIFAGANGADFAKDFAKDAGKDARKAAGQSSKARAGWSDRFADLVGLAISLPWNDGKDHLAEYGSILDLAARRLSATHTRCGANEVARIDRRAARATALAKIDPGVLALLERYRVERAADLSAPDITIDKRTIRGLKEVEEAWANCSDREARIAALDALQAQRRLGDAAFFRMLAADNAAIVREHFDDLRAYAKIVWRDPLVPAIRHIDAHRSPVWVEYGVSRPAIRDRGTHLDLATLVHGALNTVIVRARSRRYAHDLILSHGDTPNVPRADGLANLRVDAPQTLAGEIDNARLTTDRDGLVSLADLPKSERVCAAARLPWRLTYGATLPCTPIDERLIARMKTLKGSKGRNLGFSRIPHLRVLGVDLGLRHAASCAVIETLSDEEVNALCQAAGEPLPTPDTMCVILQGGRVRIPVRRVSDQPEAGWARIEQTWHLRLPGERERDRRSLTTQEGADMAALAERLEMRAPLQHKRTIDAMRDTFAMTLLALRGNNHLARIVAQLGRGHDAQLRALERLDERLHSARYHDRARTERRVVRTWVQPDQPAHEREALLAHHAATSALIDALTALWKSRDGQIRTALRWVRNALRGRHGAPVRGLGGLSLDRYALLDAAYRLQRSYLGRPTPANPRGATPHAGAANRLRAAREAVATERVRLIAHGIAAAALGGERTGTTTPKTRNHAPCQIVAIEDLSSLRTSRGNVRHRNRQIAVLAPSKIEAIVSQTCELHGLLVKTTRAAYTSRRDALTGEPGILTAQVPLWQALEGEYVRRAAAVVIAAHRARYDAAAGRYALADGRAWFRNERRAPSLLVPQSLGPIFRTAKRQCDADFNAAINIAAEPVTDPFWPAAWYDVPVDEQGECTIEEIDVRIEPTGKPTRAWRNGQGWLSTAAFWKRVENEVIASLT